MYFPACNVAHAQEAVRLDGIPDSIPEEFSGMHARTGRKSSQTMTCGSVPPAIPARSAAHAGYQSQMLFLNSGDLQLKKVSCFQNTGRFRKWLLECGHAVPLDEETKKKREELGLEPIPETVQKYPEALRRTENSS